MDKLSIPQNWPKDAPAYHSPEGWVFEKELAKQALLKRFKRPTLAERSHKAVSKSKALLTINWFLFQAAQTNDMRYHLIAKRLFDINKTNVN
jgi:hypothetical protein